MGGIHRSLVNSHRKGQWRGASMFSLICVWINRWVDNRGAGDLRRHCAHCDVMVTLYDERAGVHWMASRIDQVVLISDMAVHAPVNNTGPPWNYWISPRKGTTLQYIVASNLLLEPLNLIKSQHGNTIRCPIKCGMKLLTRSQISMVAPLRFENG